MIKDDGTGKYIAVSIIKGNELSGFILVSAINDDESGRCIAVFISKAYVSTYYHAWSVGKGHSQACAILCQQENIAKQANQQQNQQTEIVKQAVIGSCQ